VPTAPREKSRNGDPGSEEHPGKNQSDYSEHNPGIRFGKSRAAQAA